MSTRRISLTILFACIFGVLNAVALGLPYTWQRAVISAIAYGFLGFSLPSLARMQ